MRVTMLLSNGYGPDVRAQKEAHTLALAGFRVTVIAWDRAGRFPAHEAEPIPPRLAAALADWPGRVTANPLPVAVTRVQVPAGYRSGRRLLARIPAAWGRMIQELRRTRPDVVHAHDLDTLLPAYGYTRCAGASLVYDMREYYPGMVRATTGKVISRALDLLDRVLVPRCDAVVTVGERLAARCRAMEGKVWIVHNSQPLPSLAEIEAARRSWRQSLGAPDDALLVVYAGMLTPDRLLAPLLAAVPMLSDVWLVVAGDGPLAEDVRTAAAQCARICPVGWVPLDDIMPLVSAGDVVYYGLNARDPNSIYFMPNLGFFALAAGRPILTTPVGEIAEVVQREGCGVVVRAAVPGAVVEGLQQLTDAAYRATLAARARFIGQEQYNWIGAGTTLLDAYRSVADVKNCQ